ncbi:MAG TPA: TatD family hydrolase [Gemmatimonadaceae bacterium]|nr:TatD family hydrolase [Gemmatimonadaceae bacterium]
MTAPFIDSHAHLADAAFDPDRTDVVVRAGASGAEGIVCIGESLEAADRAHEIARQHHGRIAWTVGIHPHDANDFDEARDIPALRQRLAAGAAAVGECGLDFHTDRVPRDLQWHAFSAQLDLAHDAGCPVVMHTRDAEEDTSAALRRAGAAGIRGVLHCFTGSATLARTALDAGWFVSFSGIVTFKNWTHDDVLRLVPEDRLLIESDAPYLAPVPFRGKRNEPAWVSCTLDHLARVRAVEPAVLGARTAANARALFGLGSTP